MENELRSLLLEDFPNSSVLSLGMAMRLNDVLESTTTSVFAGTLIVARRCGQSVGVAVETYEAIADISGPNVGGNTTIAALRRE
jgi:hypothetical protein